MVYEADTAVKFVPIERNKLKITDNASIKLTDGDVSTVEIRRQFGSQTANANTEVEIASASSMYLGFEKTFCSAFVIMTYWFPSVISMSCFTEL